MPKNSNNKSNPGAFNYQGHIIERKSINEDLPGRITHYYQNEPGYQELFPSVYSIDIPDQGWSKSYNFFSEEYLENRGLINYTQYSLYNYLRDLRNRGVYLSIRGSKHKDDREKDVRGLAQVVGMNANTLIDNLDHLQDCLLIHRVSRLDLQGKPNEIIVHSPFTPKQLDAGKQKIIVDRISKMHTKKQREAAMKTGTGSKGGFAYLDRTATKETFQFNYKFIKDAFGEHSRKFADFALKFFKSNLRTLRTHKPDFDFQYRAALKQEMNRFNIASNAQREQCYIAANKFRVIYCPTDEEILA